ncbi:MAG: LysM peptidoglycan-binding domain-containing protein [Thiotrichaceae bacterium]|nr:LysM peptidoglycan-binding domain-containing protein [Thiotrichaceae bacterium]
MTLKKKLAILALGLSSLFLTACAEMDTQDENPELVETTVSPVVDNSQVVPPPPPVVEYHIVKRGDTVFNIAKRYGRNVAQITAWNRVKHNRIRLGQKLRVAPPVAGMSTTTPMKKTTPPKRKKR